MKVGWIPNEEKRDQYTILIDGEPWRNVHRFVFGRRPSFPKTIASMADWREAFDKLEYQAAKNYVLRRLSSQSYLSYQLKKLLTERLVQPHTIQRLIEQCVGWGYLNDENWLESFRRGQLNRTSLKGMMSKLYAKGVPREMIQELTERWKNPEEEKEAMIKIVKTKYRHKDLKDFRERQKVIGALLRKGYAYDSVKTIFKELEDMEEDIS